ncbi:MAG: thiol protease/hemagglutinin PrtT [Ignavibacteria bacterium]|nr:thiol protease/hemagglutinin PrtT [Ignavibacteria bacterium]
MKTLIISILLFLIISVALIANPVDENRASVIAKNHYWQMSAGIKQIEYANINPVIAHTCAANNQALYYVFNINSDDGFVIISADDDAYPILGYSFKGKYVIPGEHQCNIYEWMRNYEEQIKFIKDEKLKASPDIRNLWKSLSVFNENREIRGIIGPLLATEWNQDCYYNGLCPVASQGPCGRCYAGCVACAMAQVMKYWNYPIHGTGSHAYIHPTYGLQSAYFGATTYNWNSMPLQVFSSNTSVATLLYHCGVAVEMNYGPNGSGAQSNKIDSVLQVYFGYQNTADYKIKSNYSNSVWISMVINELNNFRPMTYRGTSSGGGHAFVLDGYQGTSYFHFNWGWSGSCNSYFYLTNLNPGTYNFTQGQAGVFGIQPPVSFTNLMFEDFENASYPPAGWSLSPQLNPSLWLRSTACSGYGTGTASSKFNFYEAQAGSFQNLISKTFNPTSNGNFLKFDYAYASYSSIYVDTLEIYASTNSGSTWYWVAVLEGGSIVGQGMVTAPPVSSAFVPTASQWGTKNFTLPVGTNKIAFTGVSAYGNNLYIDNVFIGRTVSVKNNDNGIPDKYVLCQNYPNPFNPSTKIKFSIVKTGIVRLKVFDILGREVTTLINEKLNAGNYEVTFNASALSSGVYFYRLQINNFTEIKKMIYTK